MISKLSPICCCDSKDGIFLLVVASMAFNYGTLQIVSKKHY
jgi:hypothetical protein